MTTAIRALFKWILERGILSWLAVLVIWELVALGYHNADLFPSPVQTFDGAIRLWSNGALLKDIGISSLRILAGWLLGTLVGIPLGLIIGTSQVLRHMIEPFINFFRFIPAIAFVTVFMMWFGIGEGFKVALITYTTLFIVALNTMMGVVRVDEEKIRASMCLGATRFQIFLYVIVPATVPFMVNGMRLAMGNSFAAIVGAEMLAAQQGVGYLIWTSRLYFQTDWIFVGLFVLGLMGFVADRLITVLSRVFLKRYGVMDGATAEMRL
ncbi:ABC transporter permease [Alicyclobacillus kakegawensis]|uniref:ABC transporter permease n=1 Tax=Alicyclobacillus kakegawensis TaxID=392012 RepID=UPI0008344E8B|nr:ABC transporter permease [Alicyclobacillus kakegawensis]